MHKIFLRNNIFFNCLENDTLVEGARKSGVVLDHSCLTGRCSTCKVKVFSGESHPVIDELSIDSEELREGYILSCVRVPSSDMELDTEDLSQYSIATPKTFPAKIYSISILTEGIIKAEVRLPPNQKFKLFLDNM
ncbi:2Fe-2S iron-sulfur cluster-binding protein [uncultured Christiangramia sp.]|uniref:2Fe-2S iron-sulfur cluster-binding protein n=1 Tax=Christiangramia sp. 3-2217-3z TaxID=3417564 RepID=UPI002607B9E8|nr:2Fe-2S iron-sulfur cluster-binding protein [uncultured Christiangramia sp.]